MYFQTIFKAQDLSNNDDDIYDIDGVLSKNEDIRSNASQEINSVSINGRQIYNNDGFLIFKKSHLILLEIPTKNNDGLERKAPIIALINTATTKNINIPERIKSFLEKIDRESAIDVDHIISKIEMENNSIFQSIFLIIITIFKQLSSLLTKRP
ncbi:hypothetical protein [Novispirillum itersonii]|uniref:hypothetical protein n=1 Tax=Novispirillum itersonii TaxID=189 RepID=UPI00037755AA|nr:hypothetical protein [Novispirillum itersonii]